ncbi:MAG: hypothetical protein HC851_18655 [Acaryochloris sp. RU_4_1]|nr:hypothetical protein [Acaryochloris sp. RU_4_1]NJR56606.1 hypothetical protein [Acaryochloris sp. CRU_2_0]
MSTSLDQWQDLTGDAEDSLDGLAEIDESEEDYSVTTKHSLATNPLIKICFWGGIILVAALGLLAIFWGVSATGGRTAKNRNQQQAAISPEQETPQLSNSDQDLVKKMLEKDTFDRQRNRQQILNGKGPNEQNKPTQAPVTPARTVTPPRIIYRSAAIPQPQRSYAPSTQPAPTFRVQRPVAVPQPEVDDPNAGYFTAPFVASAQPPADSQRKSLKLTKSESFKSNPNAKPLRLFTPPVQIASNAGSIPQPQPQQPQQQSFGNLSGSLKNPYLKQIVATASQAVIPVDTAIEAEVINRVSWIPENPGLATRKVVRLKLEQDLKDGAGDVIVSRGTIALGTVTQATEQGLITVNLTQIGKKPIQSGAVEVHQNGDPTMIAKLEKKGGNSNFLKTALDIGISGVQTLTSSLNRPTSQTALTNGDQTFLSTNNNNRNNTAAFVEGASNRIGEQLRESVSGPDQTQIGVFRFGGKVQLYFVQEVRL